MSDFNSSNPDTNTAAETIAVASQQAHSPYRWRAAARHRDRL